MSTRALPPAVAGPASSSDYNTAIAELEDASFEILGVGVLSGGSAVVSAGLTITIEASRFALGLALDKAESDFTCPDNATSYIWAVVDPLDDELCAYEVHALGAPPDRGTPFLKVTTLAGDVTDIDDAFTERVDFVPYADIVALAVNASADVAGAVAAVAAHVADTVDAHNASAISVDPTGLDNAVGDDVQEVLTEFDAAITAAAGVGGAVAIAYDPTESQIQKIQDGYTADNLQEAVDALAGSPQLRSYTTDQTLDETREICLVDATSADVTLTLPLASACVNGIPAPLPTIKTVKKIDSSGNVVHISRNTSGTIDGATSASLTAQYDAITLICDGTNWWII